MRTPQQILEECRDIMPFDLKECFDPYMIECMEIYAKEYHKSKVESGLLHSVSNSVRQEVERRRDLIISEPDGIVRETMISNLAIDL